MPIKKCINCGQEVGTDIDDYCDDCWELKLNDWSDDMIIKAIKEQEAKTRLTYLRQEIEAERISQTEILELQGLAQYIDPSDTLLLQWAGVEEITA